MNIGRYLRGEHLHVGTARVTHPTCDYPDCKCPLDAPAGRDWCAKGLVQGKPMTQPVAPLREQGR